MKIAVLGAGGQLGQKVLTELLARSVAPETVIAAVRTPAKVAPWIAHGISVRQADYDVPATLVSAFSGVQKALLIPTLAMPSDRVRQYENAITAARQAGVDHLIHFGLVPTAIEAPFVVTPFLLYVESALRISGLNWTILRNGLYADPIVEWIDDIVKMGTIPYPTGTGRCAYVARGDIARAAAAVLTTDGHEGKTYHLTGPEPLTTADLCRIASRVTGTAVVDTGATDQDYVDVCLKSGEPEGFTQLLLTLYHTIREGYLDLASHDIETLTGQPAERFEDFLKRKLTSR
ncbi:MAG: SDR family oxidoreductase [Myxococcota bacterium]|nr:SDR family oxidoreductase [Myxococcota bacterium]